MKSKFMSISWKDFFWGLFYSLIPACMELNEAFSAGEFPSENIWFLSLMKAIPLLIVYLIIHFFKNNNGELGKKDM